jgi:hypothetical protein
MWWTDEINDERLTYPAVEPDELPLVQGSKSLGLGDLFPEPVETEIEDSVANLGGRARRKNDGPPRVLKCFGECMFKRRKMWRNNFQQAAFGQIPRCWLDRHDEITEVVFITVKKSKRAI